MKTLAEKQNELRHTEILSSAFEKSINDANRSVEEKKKMLADFDVRLRNTVKKRGISAWVFPPSNISRRSVR